MECIYFVVYYISFSIIILIDGLLKECGDVMKLILNEDKEFFFIFLWILPLMPISLVFILTLYWLFLLIFILWFILFGLLFYFNHANLLVLNEKIIIKTFYRKYEIYFKEILMVKEIKSIYNSLKPIKYQILLKEENTKIPQRFLCIQNSKFKNIYKKFNTFVVKIETF